MQTPMSDPADASPPTLPTGASATAADASPPATPPTPKTGVSPAGAGVAGNGAVSRGRRGREGGLSRGRVIGAAVALADREGVGALTMRALGDELGVKAMSLYHHVGGKDDVLDGIVDAVFAEIDAPVPGVDWRAEITRRAVSARQVLRRHPWAVPLLESRRAPGPETLRHHEAVLATLRTAGFSVEATGHAYALLDAFVYGFAIQEAALPFGGERVAEAAVPIMERFATGEYPHMVEFATERVMRPGYDFGDEFDVGLGHVLDALARIRSQGGR